MQFDVSSVVMFLREQDCGQVNVCEMASSELAKSALREALYPFLSGPIVYLWILGVPSVTVMVVVAGGRHGCLQLQSVSASR